MKFMLTSAHILGERQRQTDRRTDRETGRDRDRDGERAFTFKSPRVPGTNSIDLQRMKISRHMTTLVEVSLLFQVKFNISVENIFFRGVS